MAPTRRGRSKFVLTEANLTRMKEESSVNSAKLMAQLLKELSTSKTNMSRGVMQILGTLWP